MPFPDVTEKWKNNILEVTLGTEPNQITIGGQTTLPFLHFEGETPHKPVIAMEIIDVEPEEWEPFMTEPFGDAVKNPAEWAKKCVDDFGADMICLTLYGIHPDFGDLPVDHAIDAVDLFFGQVADFSVNGDPNHIAYRKRCWAPDTEYVRESNSYLFLAG